MSDGLNTPHGGTLVDLLVPEARAAALVAEAAGLPGHELTPRQLCDLELILNGGFSPLRGFMNRKDYDGVCATMRLASGALWPIPITLDLADALAKTLTVGGRLALRDAERNILAVLTIEDLWQPDREAEAKAVFGTTDLLHPGVAHLLKHTQPWYVGGTLEGLALPSYHDFTSQRQTPAQVRAEFVRRGWTKIVAFQTRNPMHRAHVEITTRAAKDVGAKLLVHPVVGLTKPGDVDHYTRVRVYRKLLDRYPEGSAMLALLPLAMRMGGPREAVWHAIIRKNHGVTHFIVGRDHAGPGKDSAGQPFYGPYDAQALLRQHAGELGIAMVEFKMMVYAKEQDAYFPEDQVPAGATVLNISGTEQRELLNAGKDIPSWFTYPEVVEELRHQFPPRRAQGFTVLVIGAAPAAAAVAGALMIKLLEIGTRAVTMLGGDDPKAAADPDAARTGWLAAEITKHGGAAVGWLAALDTPGRASVRKRIEAEGGCVIVALGPAGASAPAPAEVGTSRSAPADLTVDPAVVSTKAAVGTILAHLTGQGFLHQ